MKGQLARWLLLGGALGFAVLGQFYFAKRASYFWDGVVFYAIAAILFLILVRDPQPAPERPEFGPRRLNWQTVVRGALIAAGLVVSLSVVAQLNTPQKRYEPLFWGWLAGMTLYLLAFVSLPGRGDRVAETADGRKNAADQRGSRWRAAVMFAGFRGWLRKGGWEWGLVLVLVLGALLLRAWRVDTIPWTLGGDEGSQGLWARDVLAGRLPNMFGLGWLSVPNMSFYWQAAWLKLFGDNVIGLRLPWAVVGALTVLGTYLLVRRLFDSRLAFLTSFLLGTYHFHIHYSRLGSNQVADPLFTVWALYFLVVGWQSAAGGSGKPEGSRGRWAWAVSGLITGLAFYFYAGSRQVPIILLACLAWAALTERNFLREHVRSLLVMFGGFVVAVGPMALLALREPDSFNARLNQVGLIQSGLLDRIAKQGGRSQWSVLAEQFRKAFFAFNFYKDRVAWYSPNIPLMDFWASLFFVLGLVVSVARLLKWRYAVFVIWFAAVMAMGGALTENPPSSQRLVSSAVPAVFFVAVALCELSKVLRGLFGGGEWGHRVLVTALAIGLAVISLRYYFGPYQQSWTYGSANAEVATRIGYYLRDLGPGHKEYFLGAPRMYADFGSTPFIAKGVPIYDVKQPLAGPPNFVDPKYKSVFIFLPERIKELTVVKQTYPNGVQEEVRRIGKTDGPVLFTVYKVQP